MNISALVTKQKSFYATGATRPVSFRLEALKKLQQGIRENEALFFDALQQDLNKSPYETYMCEIGLALDELRYHLKHLKRWCKNKRVKTPLVQFHAKTFTSPEPYGTTLIMSPWNYPFLLTIEPLIGAISGGNCTVVKPSAYAPATSHALNKLLSGLFPPEYISVIEGGRSENCALLEEPFDYIFFTGSVAVGKQVMEAASKHLAPVTLELGGKSPVIVDETANIKRAATRIMFGKIINSGQTCVAPDYVFVHASVRDALLIEMENAVRTFLPSGIHSDYPRIVNEKHFERLGNLMKSEEASIVFGGDIYPKSLQIAPTVFRDITEASPLMQEELFGPLLPVLTYNNLSEVTDYITSRPKPLALYLFTDSKETEQTILNTCSFGGGCINDTVVHLATSEAGFGGVGASGMGTYHGKRSFDTFSHERTVLKRDNRIDLRVRYHPYTEKKFRLLRKLLK